MASTRGVLDFPFFDAFDHFGIKMFGVVVDVVFHAPTDHDQFSVRVLNDFCDLAIVARKGFKQGVAYFQFHGSPMECEGDGGA